MDQTTAAIAAQEELNPFKIARKQFDAAADYLKLDESMRQVLRDTKRQLIVSVHVKLDGSRAHGSFQLSVVPDYSCSCRERKTEN